jgi:hypothetical protein
VHTEGELVAVGRLVLLGLCQRAGAEFETFGRGIMMAVHFHQFLITFDYPIHILMEIPKRQNSSAEALEPSLSLEFLNMS